jgi:transcriptional regulator with XRE-family HTH domain
MTGQELKSWRRRLGISQGKLARHLGVYQVSVSRWETGARAIPSFLPLALEALEYRLRMDEMQKEKGHGSDGKAKGEG